MDISPPLAIAQFRIIIVTYLLYLIENGAINRRRESGNVKYPRLFVPLGHIATEPDVIRPLAGVRGCMICDL